MSTTQVSAPVALAVSMEDVANTLRMDADELAAVQATLSLTLAAITQEAQHQVGRSFVQQTWKVVVDGFPCAGSIRLENGPLISVESIKYLDSAGVEQTLDPQDYFASGATMPAWIVPAPGKAWPATFNRIDSVTVTYKAGYGIDASAVPECARQYILLRLADLWDPASRKFGETAASVFAGSLLDPLRVY